MLKAFTVLRGAVPELWVVLGAKLLTILAYGVMNMTLVLWLSVDLGYSDAKAGYIVATWSTLMTLCTVFVGSFVDAIGLRKAFMFGLGVCVIARATMTFAPSKWMALSCGLLPLALGEALLTPVMVAAIRRYTTTAQRSISYSIFYAMMNVGFFFANLIFDAVRQRMGEYGSVAVPGLGLSLSTYRTLFLVSFVLSFPTLLLLYFFLREGVEATDEGVRIHSRTDQNTGAGSTLTLWDRAVNTLKESTRIFCALWRQSAFYKFLVFLALVVGVRLIVYHMTYTYPKFGIRELGAGAPLGKLWGVNSLVVVILVPIVGALTQRVSAYRMVIVGSFISASSMFLMALPPAAFEGLAKGPVGYVVGNLYLGLTGDVHPYYVLIFLFVLLLSLGESLWSPRLYEYSAAIAPKGQEASYMSLSYLPFLVAKFFVGMFSGLLLAKYCPESGPRQPQLLWLIIALPTMITPIGLFLFRNYIRVREAGRD
jgi:MFS family permease